VTCYNTQHSFWCLVWIQGDADVICGGPPCQGISGYNRNREFDAPFNCERNKQIIVFMDVIQFLKPKYIYMENVLDILKFADATLARYALSRLVAMHYQTKLGIMAAGCYGLPQFRMRVFLLGCHPKEASNSSLILGSYFLLFYFLLIFILLPCRNYPHFLFLLMRQSWRMVAHWLSR